MTARQVSTLVFFFIFCSASPQDPVRFAKEIKNIESKYSGAQLSPGLIVFTGSSSLRLWDNLEEFFPSKKIINTAFGGSQMSDLIYYADTVIVKYKPAQVFIYEGDNDLAAGEKPEDIAREAALLLDAIHGKLPDTQIILISAKPSPVRWALKDQYFRLNAKYRDLEKGRSYLKYIDLWTPLIGPNGRPRGELYISDSLHINNDGYKLWAVEIKKVLK
jgi:lysophospholipase L1-like esterase